MSVSNPSAMYNFENAFIEFVWYNDWACVCVSVFGFGAIRVPSNALNYIIIDCQKMVFVIFMENVYAGIRICMAAALKH